MVNILKHVKAFRGSQAVCENYRCLLCNEQDIFEKYALSKHSILRCKKCGFMWLDPQPQPEQLNKVYDSSYFSNKDFFIGNDSYIYGYHDYIGERFTKQEEYVHVVRRAKNYLKGNEYSSLRFLDVGCGLGFLLDVAQDEGCEVSGVEFSLSAVDAIRKKYVFPVFHGDIMDFCNDNNYDIITMMDVIEHLVRPVDAIRKIGKHLNAGGIFVLSTMDCDSFVSRLLGKRLEDFRRVSEHLYFFTRNTMRTILEREGFEVLDIRYHGHTFQLDFLADRLKHVSSKISGVAKTFINMFNLSKARVHINPGTKMLIYARKRKP